MSQSLRIVIIKPSKYLPDGTVERFRRGFMPNSTVPYMRSMTPSVVGGTPVGVHEHLQMLCEMNPTWASFYVLCPIPGTEQYDDFLAEGLITEKNLDRFDTTCLTWRHPCFSRERLSELLFECYRNFFSFRHSVRNVKDEMTLRLRGMLSRSAASIAMSLFVRYCAFRRTHPMSGGIKRVRLDGADDFLPLRREAYDFELAPLPQSLQLPVAERKTVQSPVEIQPSRLLKADRYAHRQ